MNYTEEELRNMSMEKLNKIEEKIELEQKITKLIKKKLWLEIEIQEMDEESIPIEN